MTVAHRGRAVRNPRAGAPRRWPRRNSSLTFSDRPRSMLSLTSASKNARACTSWSKTRVREVPVGGGQRRREPGQLPLEPHLHGAQAEAVADGLQGGRVIARWRTRWTTPTALAGTPAHTRWPPSASGRTRQRPPDTGHTIGLAAAGPARYAALSSCAFWCVSQMIWYTSSTFTTPFTGRPIRILALKPP